MKKVSLLITIIVGIVLGMSTTYPSMAAEIESDRARLVIESYEAMGSFVAPGSEFEVELTIKNTHSELVAKNVVLSVINNQGIAFPIEGHSNQIFIGDIEAGSSYEVKVPIRISEIVKNVQDVVLQINLSYSDLYTLTISENAYISIPLKQECKLEIIDMQLTDYSYATKKTTISSEIKNDGVVEVEDVKLHIVLEDGTDFVYDIGDVACGLTKYFDHTICIEQAGEQIVTVYMTYSDEMGNEATTEKTEYLVKVLEGGNSLKTDLQSSDTTGVNERFWIKNLVLVLIAFVIIVVFHKRDTRRINSRKEVGDGK